MNKLAILSGRLVAAPFVACGQQTAEMPLQYGAWKTLRFHAANGASYGIAKKYIRRFEQAARPVAGK